MKRLDELLTMVILLMASGCTAPLVSLERSGPLIQNEITVKDTGNGNNVEGLPL